MECYLSLQRRKSLFSVEKKKKHQNLSTCAHVTEKEEKHKQFHLLFFPIFPFGPCSMKIHTLPCCSRRKSPKFGFKQISCFLDESSHSFTTFGTLTGRWFRTGATVAPDGPATKDAGHLMWFRGHWLVISRTSSSRSRPWSRCLWRFIFVQGKSMRKTKPFQKKVLVHKIIWKNPPN